MKITRRLTSFGAYDLIDPAGSKASSERARDSVMGIEASWSRAARREKERFIVGPRRSRVRFRSRADDKGGAGKKRCEGVGQAGIGRHPSLHAREDVSRA